MKSMDKKVCGCISVPNVLFLGNGINRAYGISSWEEIIKKISTGEYDSEIKDAELLKKLPYSLQTIVLSSDSVSDGMKEISNYLIAYKPTDELLDAYRKLVSLPFDALLTTNYSYEVEKALLDDFTISVGRKSPYRQNTIKGNKAQEQFGIYKYFDVGGKRIWHIHGEAARVQSMVMGHYYYGKLLCEIQKRVPEILRELAVCKKKKSDFIPKSWIDYFLIGNVYVVGFGLDPAEMDIWWLINCKKRNFSEYGSIYFYEPNLNTDSKYTIKALADTLNVKCFTDTVKKDADYIEFYKKVTNKLKRLSF